MPPTISLPTFTLPCAMCRMFWSSARSCPLNRGWKSGPEY
jgi:hypothetical protein